MIMHCVQPTYGSRSKDTCPSAPLLALRSSLRGVLLSLLDSEGPLALVFSFLCCCFSSFDSWLLKKERKKELFYKCKLIPVCPKHQWPHTQQPRAWFLSDNVGYRIGSDTPDPIATVHPSDTRCIRCVISVRPSPQLSLSRGVWEGSTHRLLWQAEQERLLV